MIKRFFQICILLLSCSVIISCANPNGTCNCEDCQCNKPTNKPTEELPNKETPKEEETDPIVEIIPFGNYECIKREHWSSDHIVQTTDTKSELTHNNMTLADNVLSGSLRNVGRENLKLHLEKDGKFTNNDEFTWVYSSNVLELHFNFGQPHRLERYEDIFFYTLKK